MVTQRVMETENPSELLNLKRDYKSMRLLIDLDGVICEYKFSLLVKNFFGVDLSSKAIFAYDLADVLGVAPALINTMFKEQVYGPPNFINGSLEVLQSWKDKGYRILIFSNRVKFMGIFALRQWLINYKIPFDDIDIYATGEYDFQIDDSPSKLAAPKSIIKLLYTQPWNKGCLDIQKQMIRVNSWVEIKSIVG